jgi:hypothetical protein
VALVEAVLVAQVHLWVVLLERQTLVVVAAVQIVAVQPVTAVQA